MNKTFIFDYDDTLAWNEYCYSFAELKLTEWIMNKFGPRTPKPYEIGNLEVAIDKAAVDTMGFSMQRFPTSCRETYRKICEIKNVVPAEADLETAYGIGMLAFDENLYKQQGLVDDAAETLDFLLEKNDELILLSKGEHEIQERKFKATEVRKWFGDKVYIVPKKNKDMLIPYIGERDKTRVWHVGNSIRSDVQPALDAGISVLYIPCETWAWEMEHKGIPNHPRLKTISKIIEIKQNYEMLTT